MKLPDEKDYPSRIKINKKYYELEFVKGFKDFGECDIANREIVIRSGLSKRELLKTLIHEALHGAEREYKLKLSHPMVYTLEKAIYKFLVDNFDLK